MPAHAKAIERLQRAIGQASTRTAQDAVLDEILDVQQSATEWDADRWGFNPDRWMAAERAELASRGGMDWPREP
ncbi:hypothetical protein [Actinomadura luteofluorescens]|uniref:hypothetical protein n=1 Tax=Actinomadura luteofluorescens TaxID=46163 RepID=UPI003D93F6E0